MGRPTKAEQLEITQRRTRAAQLRMAGVDWSTIAAQVGYNSANSAIVDHRRAKDQALAGLTETLTEQRTLELERYDRMLAAIWPQVTAGDVRAIEAALKVSKERKALLGLDKPTQHEVVTIDAVDREIARLSERLGKAAPLVERRALDDAGA